MFFYDGHTWAYWLLAELAPYLALWLLISIILIAKIGVSLTGAPRALIVRAARMAGALTAKAIGAIGPRSGSR